MKIKCYCGHLVIESDATKQYWLMEKSNWDRFLSAIEDGIVESRLGFKSADDLIMEVLTKSEAQQVLECPVCGRWITCRGGEWIFYRKELEEGR